MGAAEGDNGVDRASFLKFEEDLGGSGDDEGIGLLTVGFDEELVEITSASGDDFLF